MTSFLLWFNRLICRRWSAVNLNWDLSSRTTSMSTSISTTGFVSYLSTLYRRCLFDIDLPLSTFIYLFAPVYPPGTVRHVGGADGTAREGDTTRCLSSPAVADAETTQRFAPPGGVVLDHSDVHRSVHCYQSPSCCCWLLVLSGRTTLMLLTVVAVFLIVEFPLAILFVILIVQNTVASSGADENPFNALFW